MTVSDNKLKNKLKDYNSRKDNNIGQIKGSKQKQSQMDSNTSYHLIPVFLILCIIPFIMRVKEYNTHMSQFPWFSNADSNLDIFLYYKQWLIIITACIMAVAIVFKLYSQRKKIQLPVIFIPLIVYAILAFLSAIFSKYISFCFSGSFEMFESVFALLGYCIITYYTFLFINTEKDIKIVLYFLICTALIMSCLGLFQFLGYDFFKSQLGKNLLIPYNLRSNFGLQFNFEVNRVYLTLCNPDYVGVYVAMVMPVIMVMLFYQKKILIILLSVLSVIGLIICGIGSKSLTGIISLIVTFVLIPIFMWRYLVKHYIITISVVIILLLGILAADKFTNHYFIDKMKSNLYLTKEEYLLTDIHTEDDGVKLTYKNNAMKVQRVPDENQTLVFKLFDENNQLLACDLDSATGLYKISDNRFSDIALGWDIDNPGAFFLLIEGRKWSFTNLTGDGSYYYLNYYKKPDKIITAPSALFTGYEKLASNRGYIWSRSIPLLKNYIFLGSGPDTYTMAFPQQDYLGLIHGGLENQLLTKPHNMYLQMGVQTGLLSLIAFLLFYLIYFITSIRLYIRGRFNSIYAKYGVAIFIGTISYMITGLANDSNVNTAPLFWLMMGAGIAINSKAKPLIQEELASVRGKNSTI